MPTFNQAMQALVTVTLLGLCSYLLACKNTPATAQKWAYGTLGTLLGYWLHAAN
jgi:hypothetical protein